MRWRLFRSRWATWGFASLLFALAFLPRAIEPISRPVQWYLRSIAFFQALAAGDWFGTFQRHHPGVTTMWLSGAGMKALVGFTDARFSGIRRYQPDATAAGVVPLALIIAACIVLAVFLLARLADRRVALTAGLLLALDPAFVAYSKVLHVDGLLMAFTFMAVLCLLWYARTRGLVALAFSALFIGLSVLTKSPALSLCPFAALVVAYAHYANRDRDAGGAGIRARVAWLQPVVVRGLMLIAMICVVGYVLFPALWSHADDVAARIYRYVVLHVNTPHKNPVFFAGSVTNEDPGAVFYLVTILVRTTFLTLPMALVAILIGLSETVRRRSPYRELLWGLMVFAFLYFCLMSFGAKKDQRYILPVYPLLDVLAAVGLVRTAELVSQRVSDETRRYLLPAIISLPLLAQAAVVLSHHPHYGLHANYLLGGPGRAYRLISLQKQAEGTERAAHFLNSQPDAGSLRVTVMGPENTVLFRRFVGKIGRKKVLDPGADYRLYLLDPVLRGRGTPEWWRMRRHDLQREPAWALTRNGVTFAALYRRADDDPKFSPPKKKRKKGKKNRRWLRPRRPLPRHD